jgi:PIN domain nuclease of toxin-antitoxin system
MPPGGDRVPAANAGLSKLHDDPADRVIVATALVLGMPLITRDRRLQDYPHLENIR